jgi:hypothetical protein
MKTTELFSGSKSFSKVRKELGDQTFTIDNIKQYNPDWCIDILKITDLSNCNVLWASPPCTTFSVASIGTHWAGGGKAYIPKTKECKIGLKILDKTIKLIAETKPKYWYLENPRGVMRKVIDNLFNKYGVMRKRHTITYCQYGDTRMKPTDIWTNNDNWKPRKVCKNGDNCHESAPRGSKTGTQGLKNDFYRSAIPKELFIELYDSEV